MHRLPPAALDWSDHRLPPPSASCCGICGTTTIGAHRTACLHPLGVAASERQAARVNRGLPCLWLEAPYLAPPTASCTPLALPQAAKPMLVRRSPITIWLMPLSMTCSRSGGVRWVWFVRCAGPGATNAHHDLLMPDSMTSGVVTWPREI